MTKKTKKFKYQRTSGTTAEHCRVYLCQNSSKYNGVLSFFTFPVDEELRRKWVVAIRRDLLIITPHARVCSRHFKKEDIREPTSQKGRRLLKKGAVPALFEWNNFSLPPPRPGVWEGRQRPPPKERLPESADASGQDDHDYTVGPDLVLGENLALQE